MDWPAKADEFRRFLLTHGATAQSANGYVWHTKVFFEWALARETDPQLAETRAIETYIASQLAELSAMTAYNRLMALRAWFRYLIATGVRTSDPSIDLKVRKPKRQPVQPFSLREMQRLLMACDSIRDRAIILVLTDTGLRISELLGIKAQDINWKTGELRVLGKGRKERWVACNADSLAALKLVVRDSKAGNIWGTKRGTDLTPQQCRKNLCAVAVRAGVARTYPHRFRSTYANFFLEGGGDIGALQANLGHADISTTNFYAGYTRAQRGLDQNRKLNLAGRLLE